jgi:hypothetical protein
MNSIFMRTVCRLVAWAIAASLAFSLSACKPSEAEREHELRAFVKSVVDGTSLWERYTPVSERTGVLEAKPHITANFQILDWDQASVCCGLRDDLYEYRLRFSNTREAVSYVSVERGRITQITLDLDNLKPESKTAIDATRLLQLEAPASVDEPTPPR